MASSATIALALKTTAQRINLKQTRLNTWRHAPRHSPAVWGSGPRKIILQQWRVGAPVKQRVMLRKISAMTTNMERVMLAAVQLTSVTRSQLEYQVREIFLPSLQIRPNYFSSLIYCLLCKQSGSRLSCLGFTQAANPPVTRKRTCSQANPGIGLSL